VRCQPSKPTRIALVVLRIVSIVSPASMSLTLRTMIWARDDFPDAGIPDRPTISRVDVGILCVISM